jgi:hypothetical protein
MINCEALAREARLMEAAGESHRLRPFLQEAMEAGDLTPNEFSLREGYEELVPGGRQEIRSWQRNQEFAARENSAVRRELFMNVNSMLVSAETMAGFNDITFIGDQLVSTRPSTMIDGEKIAGTTRIGATSEEIGEGQPYGASGFSEDWIQTPEMRKRGTKIGLTKELVIGDKTGQLFDRCRDVGYGIRYDKEIRILDMVLGMVPGVYKRKNNTAVDVYGDNSGDHNWDNLLSGNGLVDWTDIEAATLQYEALTDPNTGLLISVTPDTVIVPSALKLRARHILGAESVDFVDNQANAATYRTRSRNLVDSYNIISSPLVASRTSSATTWFMGAPKRAFRYLEAWPLTVVQAPAGHPADFDQDIVAQWKASEMGVAACIEPRYMLKLTT